MNFRPAVVRGLFPLAALVLLTGCPPRPRSARDPHGGGADRGAATARDAGVVDRPPTTDAAVVRFEAAAPDEGAGPVAEATDRGPESGPEDAGPALEVTVVAALDAAPEAPADDAVAPGEATADAATPSEPADVHAPTGPEVAERLGLRFVEIPAGSFRMGSPADEPGRNPNEELRQVTLTRGFEMSQSEVTQGQYERWMGENPSWTPECGADCPVSAVSWHMAAAFANRLSEAAGLEPCYACEGAGEELRCSRDPRWRPIHACPGYRLPTEAEWEYAARAGTDTAFPNGAITAAGRIEDTGECERDPRLDEIGWYCANSDGTAHPVCSKSSNAWGLCDMAGNVAEWTNDDDGALPGGTAVDPVAGTGFNRALRGGTWARDARRCRSAARDFAAPYLASDWNGFRVVRTIR